jgi:hypothetical protein
VLARLEVAALDAFAERELFLGAQQRDLVDLLQVRFQAAFGRNGKSPVWGSSEDTARLGVSSPPIDWPECGP